MMRKRVILLAASLSLLLCSCDSNPADADLGETLPEVIIGQTQAQTTVVSAPTTMPTTVKISEVATLPADE